MVLKVANQINQFFNNVGRITKNAATVTETVEQVVAPTFAGVMLGRGTYDFVEAVVCQDGVCAVVSAIGCTADAIEVLASFGSGSNLTIPYTQPVSAGCKTFVFMCKTSKRKCF